MLDGEGHLVLQLAMIDGAQGMQSARAFGYDSIAGDREHAAQQFRRQVGHVAGHHQHPLTGAERKGSEQPAEGPTILHNIGMCAAAYHGYVSHGVPDHPGHVLQQGSAEPGQQSFIAPHSGAAASCQHKPGRLFHGVHEKIVAVLGINRIACFALTLFALVPLHAESTGARKLVVKADKRSGRLVTVVVSANKPAVVRKAPPANIAQIVADASKANNIDPLLVHSVIQVESNYNTYAISTAGARGLMQLMPGTARDLGVTDSFDPRQNIEAGVKYLKKLKDQYQDDRLALAAYNAGPGSVQKYKTVPPYPETRDYVQRVGERYEDARKAAGIAPAVALQPEQPQELPQVPAVLSEVPTEEKHARLERFLDEYGRLHLRTVPE